MPVNPLLKAFDLLQGPRIFELGWHLLTGVSRLRDNERDAAGRVLGPESVRYAAVRVAEGRILPLIFKINGSRAFTLFHTIICPLQGVVPEAISICWSTRWSMYSNSNRSGPSISGRH